MNRDLDVMEMPGQKSESRVSPVFTISDKGGVILTIEQMRLWNSTQETGYKPKQQDAEEAGAR